MGLKCPRCKNIDLDPITYRGVTIDKCPSCSGVWLDEGEERFVVEILANAKGATCHGCMYFESSKSKCKLLKIFVKRDFACVNFVKI